MSNPTVNLNTIELVATLRPWPQNGSPSSSDYNALTGEILADLASVSEFVNDNIRPLVNGLMATAAQPSQAPVGIEGRTVYTDSSDSTALFFNPRTSLPLSVADTIRVINGMISGIANTVNNLNLQVLQLNTQLSTSEQNDVAKTLQNFADTLASLQTQLSSQQATIGSGVIVPDTLNGHTYLVRTANAQITLTQVT